MGCTLCTLFGNYVATLCESLSTMPHSDEGMLICSMCYFVWLIISVFYASLF